MDVNRLCPNCMNEMTEGSNVCSHCGFEIGGDGEKNNHALEPYTILQGKYLVGNVIGEGGFGITYIGFDLNLEIKIAIKEFYPNGYVTRESNVTAMVTNYTVSDSSQYEKWKESFVREARSLAKFSNLPGIVHVRDFFQENNTAYIVMEFVEGKTLKSHLKEHGGRISSDEVIPMMRPVIRSLAKVHSSGIIHRDISPDNIMIQKDGSVRLIDFGAARDFGAGDEKSLSIMLKPGFAPEEQYRSKGNQGPWTDVYALCATIFRCITGEKPPESMERMREDRLRPPSSYGIDISLSQEKALLEGMAVFAENRINNMEELESKLYGDSAQASIQHGSDKQGRQVHHKKTALPSGGVSSVNKKIMIGIAALLTLAVIILALIIVLPNRNQKADVAEAEGIPTVYNASEAQDVRKEEPKEEYIDRQEEVAEETPEDEEPVEEITEELPAPVEEAPAENNDIADEYIAYGSDSFYFDKTYFEQMTNDELRIARNEIYARHGRMFKDAGLQEYFNSKSWYYPIYSPEEFDPHQESILNNYEIYNRDLIVEVEKERK